MFYTHSHLHAYRKLTEILGVPQDGLLIILDDISSTYFFLCI